jgi:16S rRNA C1402 (ribose-2'-O) methylase RsmI
MVPSLYRSRPTRKFVENAVIKLLAYALEVLGDRRAAVCIELTKQFEKTQSGLLSELVELYREAKIRSEVTVVIAGNNPKFAAGYEESKDGPEDGEP